MQKIILTVQSTGNNKFRLGITYKDSLTYFKVRRAKVLLCCNNDEFDTITSCGPPLCKGFDLYSNEIHHWIVKNDYHNYPKGIPTKFEFSISNNNDKIILNLLKQL